MSTDLLESGVTAFLPTLQTDTTENMEKAIQTITKAAKRFTGAKMLGIFLEGPFLAEKFKAAQDGRYFQKPSIPLLEKWQEMAEGNIKKIAIAPELEGAQELIAYATQKGITVAMGHSDATKEDTKQAVGNGAKVLVHSFNAMRGLHHREPGILGVGLTDDHVFAEMICDGYHIDPLIADLIIRAKGTEKTILITDGTLASGFKEGAYKRAAIPVIVKDGAVRTTDGKLAGSSLSMIQAVRNVINWKIASIEEAILFATYNPSRSLNLSHYGEIKKGLPADFTVLDKNLNVVATYIDGIKKYSGGEASDKSGNI